MTPQPRQRFAQHWLRSEAALEQIVEAACVKNCDRILEIGPGTGILTYPLLEAARSVVAVEIDRDLCKRLIKRWGQREDFLLLQGDILSLNVDELLEEFPNPNFKTPNKVVANLPYNITGPILERLLGTIARPRIPPYDTLVLLVQKEVGDRLVAQPNSKTFGALSVRMQYLAQCDFIYEVPASAFSPPPKVNSAVVRLTPWRDRQQQGQVVATDPRHLATLVKLGFSSRRKMLRNNLKGSIDRDRLTPLLEQLEIDPNARAEQLSVEQWVALSNQLVNSSV
ncbi:MAG: 16S rRNA (adenine(1518)-N(6)/adenine(1519)-N(6))-dimethyltransferase RsmA [Cyanobacteriota bacterium]|nr:16S rRNA (adenine(1518)-N(6)/adenine(1519)-N(6))-dimethyltransferase RsmA [Cyanobacteriota bacterium]